MFSSVTEGGDVPCKNQKEYCPSPNMESVYLY
jgi:hypothetical protein